MESAAVKKDEHLRLEFNEWARDGRGESMEQGHRPIGVQAIELMNIPPAARVLDVGCGSGWATRCIADKAAQGRVTGIDISNEMVEVARASSAAYQNVRYELASAESLPFRDGEFTHVFSMESLYYYSNMVAALREIKRVLESGGLLVTVIDLYLENSPSHQWIPNLKVPVHLLGIPDYRSMLEQLGFVNIKDQRLYDPAPVPDDYAGGSFKTREDYLLYKRNGSLMLSAGVVK
ncbi:MAG TPA: methyltransferase domain-containing protein [Pyrinomonadaceae bacterium]|nr:methyltransferase domain-containing protein [Pyrinomonadaceae bacterium]